ncbi:cupin domain-containing protein [Ruegeria sp. 2205SS24-7]|uniref:cupin domain-containing protein n=1 Tax=Ruegeria discodermiae TaxID=3064389 RepID=UPI002740B545|nr:cupin domain-containing protein [Ruegeria sp. 2205SS24-7]MDP5219525.1 cupin domain-containing protein [Ruegeria sp. 2205SS24-7]
MTHCVYNDSEILDFPGAITLRILLGGDQTGGALEAFEDIVQPGVGPPRHVHLHQDETFFFLEGDFEVEIAGKRARVAPGDLAFIPRGTEHAFKNVGASPGRLRYVFSPAYKMEEMFRALHAAQQSGALNPEEMARIAPQYGQEFTGPPL